MYRVKSAVKPLLSPPQNPDLQRPYGEIGKPHSQECWGVASGLYARFDLRFTRVPPTFWR